MNELIKVNYENTEQPTVSGRELHEALEIKTPYPKWFARMTEYGFTENIDFTLVRQNCPTNNPKNPLTTIENHEVTLDMAKEICMIQRSDKGKMIRQYFIAVEKQWNTPEAIMARALQLANNRLNLLQEQNKALETRIQADKPKVVFADSVAASNTCILIGELAKILKGNGYNIGQNRMFAWLRSRGYLISRKGTDYNMPTQRSMELGLFQIKETSIVHSDGHVSISKTPKVTGKGQQYLIDKFLNDKEIIA